MWLAVPVPVAVIDSLESGEDAIAQYSISIMLRLSMPEPLRAGTSGRRYDIIRRRITVPRRA